MTIAEGIVRLREQGLTVTLTETGDVRMVPMAKRNPAQVVWVKDNKAEVVAYLQQEAQEQPETMQVELGTHPKPNYTQVPNVLLDAILPSLSLTERAVLLYIWRRCAGFHRTSDCISISQMCTGVVTKEGKRLDYGTGISRRAVIQALAKLRVAGYIQEHSESGKTTRYTIHIDEKRDDYEY